MKVLENIYINKKLQNELTYLKKENNPCHGVGNISIIVHKKKVKKRKKIKLSVCAHNPVTAFRLLGTHISKKKKSVRKHSSMPEFNKSKECVKPISAVRTKSYFAFPKKNNHQFHSTYEVNIVSERRLPNPFYYSSQMKCKIYRCQIITAEDSCCCSCNSDAMFEVMKSLYDCYKKKNCDHCDCILCSHKLREERRLGELRKSLSEAAIEGTPSAKQIKEKMKKAEKILAKKSPAEKEQFLRDLVKTKQPLPEGKTASEKSLVNKVRAELGLPPEPKNAAERAKMRKAEAAGIITPLEGKSPEQKAKILKALADMGIPLPEGRTPSEKSLIRNTKAAAAMPGIAPEKLRKAQAAGLLSPLHGTPAEREKILRDIAELGLPLPEGKTPSDKKIIRKVRTEIGLPPEPETPGIREKHVKASNAGVLYPLEGKSPKDKEKILRALHGMDIPLPEGRTPSEKSLIAKITGLPAPPSGLLTPLTGKTPEQKEKILKDLAKQGILLPEGKTPSEKKILDKVREELGLPPEPTTPEMKEKHIKAAKAGLLQPLEGKTPSEKAKILKGLQDLGIPLPKGREPSEKALISKIKSKASKALSDKKRAAKAPGLVTPLAGKSPAEKEKILKDLAMAGIPLPEGKTASEKKLIDKIRAQLGLPPEPTTPSMKEKHAKAAEAGILQPLEGKSPKEKEKILKGLHEMGIPLPEGRTPSEKALVAKVTGKPTPPPEKLALSEKMKQAKAAGLLTPLTGKKPEQQEKILKDLAKQGIPLPEVKTPSEKKITDKVREELGLPPEPTTPEMKEKHMKAAKAGLLQPLEGKTPEEKAKILEGLQDLGIPLPKGREPSEKALISKIKSKASKALLSDKKRAAKAPGLVTPLAGKSPAEKEKILKDLAMAGIPLPEGKTASEKKLIDKIRAQLGLPPEPTTPSMKDKHAKAAEAGLLQPLEGKSPKEKEKVLKGLHEMGIPLPEGRTPSEKALVAKVTGKPAPPPEKLALSEKMKQAKATGLLTPLTGKTPEQKEKILKDLAKQGIPLPEVKTPSEKKITDKVREELGLPPEPTTPEMKEKHMKAAKAGLLQPLEGKTPEEKAKILEGLQDLGIPLPKGREPSEKALISKIKSKASKALLSDKKRAAKAPGLLTPLTGKSPAEKEKILKDLAMAGIPLPEGKTASEKKLIDKIRAQLGLPPEPTTPSMKDKHAKAAEAGLLQPLEGKSPKEKEKVLKGLHEMGIPLPEGRTPSEKALVAKVTGKPAPPLEKLALSEKMKQAKAAGLLTPLTGKTPEQQEKILKDLAKQGIPLPEVKTPSEKKITDKVREELGLPPEPTTPEMKEKHAKAAKAGLLQPLEGKTPEEKVKILEGLQDLGIPLPKGREPSEKALISKIKSKASKALLSDKKRAAKAPGLVTPLAGKSPAEKEKILKDLAMAGIPLPEGKTASEKKLIDKIRAQLGLPPEPTTPSMKEKHAKAAEAGLLQPLEGKSPKEKEKVLKGLHEMGIPLPEGRTPSEKALVAKVTGKPAPPLEKLALSEKMKQAKAAGLLTPLTGKTPEQQEKILKDLAKQGIPLPEVKTPSEKKITDKVREELGLPPEPTTPEMKEKHAKAAKAGLLQPLEGKTPEEKAKILEGLQDLGIPLPKGREPSEKALIAKIKSGLSKTAGRLSPLKGKTPAEKEKLLRGLAMQGVPLPEGKTTSEKKLTDKVRADLGLPPEPTTPAMKDKHQKAAETGLLWPLEGKSPKEKEKILKGLHDMGIPLPEGRTPSEKALIAKVLGGPAPPLEKLALSEKIKQAKAAGLLTPLTGKTPEQKQKILKDLAKQGIPLPEGKSPSEKKIIDKVREELGLPPEPTTPEMKEKHVKAARAGLLQPLEGKSPEEKAKILEGLQDLGIPPPKAAGIVSPLKGKTPVEKEKILKDLAMKGLPLPEAQTASEKKIAEKVRKEVGLPPEPQTASEKEKMRKAVAAGIVTPLEGKTPSQKERIVKGMIEAGIPVPEGRKASEKAMIKRVLTEVGKLPPKPPSKRMVGRPALSPEERVKLDQKTAKVIKEGKGPVDECICDLLTPESEMEAPPPKSPSVKARKTKAADLISPLQEKTPAPEEAAAQIEAAPRPPSMHVPTTERMRRAKAAGLITPLSGKTPDQKEKILKGLAMYGIPLPEGKTPSEKKLIDKVRADLGLPPDPTTPEMKEKHAKAAKAGFLQPLEGKTPEEKRKILQGLHDAGIPLPKGRTASEKSIIAKIKALSPKVPEKKRPSKATGVLSPLKGKTPAEKEKILRGIAMQGVPLPEGKTTSDKKLTDKVRTELGLPPEPTTPAMKDKHQKASEGGFLQPLEGKSPKDKEKILKSLHGMGIPLPVGRTPSEKALIDRIKAGSRAPSEKIRKAKEKAVSEKAATAASITTDKIKKAKAAGLLTPLSGKTPEEKEKILRGLAKAGLPLPEGRKPSEKALVSKIKKDLGIPDRTPSEKLRKAKAAGLLTPLEGKTPAQKEKILRGRAAAGLPLPVSKTLSDKALIQKIKDETGHVTPSPSERLRKAKAAGLITPLKGKPPSKKERILKDMLAAGVPIPEGETPSEKEIVKKLIAEQPKAASAKIKQPKAAGLSSPLQGKTPEQKSKILKDLIKAGLPLPEPKTASEKDLVAKIRQETGLPPEPKTASLKEKYKKAQASGLITPLEGKTPAQKENILKKLHDAGIPLPEGRTPSEKLMIKKVKSLPPPKTPLAKTQAEATPPKTPSGKVKAEKAAGLVSPLEGKTPSQKEKILQSLAKAGKPLPEGTTPSEKEKAEKAAALVSPLEGKAPAEKEKILKSLAKARKPLPEGKTPSEKDLIDKTRKELGLPPEPKTESMKEKMRKAHAAGLITPLEGKSPSQKEKKLKAMTKAGIPLPEGRTPSEKALIAKVEAEAKARKGPPEKVRKSKAATIIPLEGKPPEEKEQAIKDLAKRGLPLPEAKTPSEKALAEKVRKELGLPPEPKSPSMKEKHAQAAAAGFLKPLEGLSPAEKEKALRGQAALGLDLPEGRPPSEKALIDKIIAEGKQKKVPPEKLEKAKAAGLLTPLEGKTPAEKEKVLKGLAEAGLPLPEGKTASEKALISKVKTELAIPPTATTPSEKAVIQKAKAEGLFTPLAGKTPAQKEKILRGLAEAGLPLPVGKTPSEKELIKKIRAEAGLPLVPTPSEKMGKIKKKSKKIGVKSEKLAKGIAAAEFEDVIKTTTCDRGCGCDKKKIRFKHSYIKIKVTSPDISSLCPCPNECIPGVKGGAFIDNEGIKVTVGRASGGPIYSSEGINANDELELKDRPMRNLFEHAYKRVKASNSLYEVQNFVAHSGSNKVDFIVNITRSDESCNTAQIPNDLSLNKTDTKSFLFSSSTSYEGGIDKLNRFIENSKHFESSSELNSESVSTDYNTDNFSRESFDSLLVIKSETSLGLSTNSSASMNTASVMSFADSSVTSNSTHYFGYQLSNDIFSDSSTEESDYSTNSIIYNTNGMITSTSTSRSSSSIEELTVNRNDTHIRNITNVHRQQEYHVFRMSETAINLCLEKKDKKYKQKPKAGDVFLVINQLNSERDISSMIDELLAKNEFSEASSIFVVVPSDDNDADISSDGRNSTICIQLSTYHTKWKNNANSFEQGIAPVSWVRLQTQNPHGQTPRPGAAVGVPYKCLLRAGIEPATPGTAADSSATAPNEDSSVIICDLPQRGNSVTSHGVKISGKGKRFFLEGIPSTVLSYQNKETMFGCHQLIRPEHKHKERTKNKLCQITTPNEIVQVMEHRYNVVSTDTTADRPCCCPPKQHQYSDYTPNDRYVANVTSKQITPLLVKQGLHCDPFHTSRLATEPEVSILSLNIEPTPAAPCETQARIQSQVKFNVPEPNQCQCTSKKLRDLLELAIKAGRETIMKSIGCGGQESTEESSGKQPDCDMTCCQRPLVDEFECSSVKQRKKIRPMCPCGLHHTYTPKTEQAVPSNEPCPNATSEPCPQAAACQEAKKKAQTEPCPKAVLCDETCPTIPSSPVRQMGQTHLLGPAGESIKTGETCTQAGTKQTRFCSNIGTSTDPKMACPCKDKHDKKKKHIKCECPEPEPEPLLSQWMDGADFEWLDKKEIGKMHSNLTERVSGFKFFQKKRPPAEPEPEYTLDDALRYYASVKPELFIDIIQDQWELKQKNPSEHELTKKAGKHKKKKVDCECPREEALPRTPPPPLTALTSVSDSERTETRAEGPLGGLTIKMGGKGSASPGLAGICCFDLLQESFTTW